MSDAGRTKSDEIEAAKEPRQTDAPRLRWISPRFEVLNFNQSQLGSSPPPDSNSAGS